MLRAALDKSQYAGQMLVGHGVVADALSKAAGDGSLLVCSRSCLPLLAGQASEGDALVPASIERAELDAIELPGGQDAYQRIVAVGAGRVIDVAKYLAARHGLALTVAPSVLSGNAFATAKSVIRANGRHVTVATQAPQSVLIDPAVLSRVPMRWHLLGISDVLSTYTALFDWQLAAESGVEEFDSLTAGLAQVIRDHAFDLLETVVKLPPASLYQDLARLLLLSGMVTSVYGSGRPESGSEHMVARVMEQEAAQIGHLWHGEAVLTGILLCASLQRQRVAGLYKFAGVLGLHARLSGKGVSSEVLAGYLRAAASVRDDRFTVLNVAQLSVPESRMIASEVLRRLSASQGLEVASGALR